MSALSLIGSLLFDRFRVRPGGGNCVVELARIGEEARFVPRRRANEPLAEFTTTKQCIGFEEKGVSDAKQGPAGSGHKTEQRLSGLAGQGQAIEPTLFWERRGSGVVRVVDVVVGALIIGRAVDLSFPRGPLFLAEKTRLLQAALYTVGVLLLGVVPAKHRG